MNQVVIQYFDLNGVPQPEPRAREHARGKLAPPLRECALDGLPHRTEQMLLLFRRAIACQHKDVVFCADFSLKLLAAITKIADDNAFGRQVLGQVMRRRAIFDISGRENQIDDFAARRVRERVQFEAEKPALRRLAPRGGFVPQKAHRAVSDGQTHGNGKAVNQKHCRLVAAVVGEEAARARQQRRQVRLQAVQARQPLFVRRQARKTTGSIIGDQPKRLFQSGDFQHRLHHGNRQHFGVREIGRIVVRVTPLQKAGMLFEQIVHKAKDLGQSVFYVMFQAVVILCRELKFVVQKQLYTLGARANDFSVSTQD